MLWRVVRMWRTAARVSSANVSVSDGIGNRGIVSLLHLLRPWHDPHDAGTRPCSGKGRNYVLGFYTFRPRPPSHLVQCRIVVPFSIAIKRRTTGGARYPALGAVERRLTARLAGGGHGSVRPKEVAHLAHRLGNQ